MPDISKINLNGTTYNIRDDNALTETDADTKYVEKITSTTNAVYVQQNANVTTTISMDQNTAFVKQIVTKDDEFQIYKSTYASGVGALLDQNVLNKKEVNELITSKNYATQSYVQEQLATVKPKINVVYGNALPTQAQMYQYCVQYNNGTALLRYKPSSGSDLLIPLCTLSLLGSGNFTAIFEFTSVSGSKMTKRCYIISGSNSGGSAVSTLNQTEWIFN